MITMKRLILFLSAMLFTRLSTGLAAKTLVVYYSYTAHCREIEGNPKLQEAFELGKKV